MNGVVDVNKIEFETFKTEAIRFEGRSLQLLLGLESFMIDVENTIKDPEKLRAKNAEYLFLER